MALIEEKIIALNEKLQELLKKYALLQKENRKLSTELAEIDKNRNASLEKTVLLEMENSILKASAGKMEEKEKVVFDKKISQYIKDLEKCMNMLNK